MPPILSIKQMISNKDEVKAMLQGKGFDPAHVLKIEYLKAEKNLNSIIGRTERSLISEQAKGNDERSKSIETTLNELLYIWGHLVQQNARIMELESTIKRKGV